MPFEWPQCVEDAWPWDIRNDGPVLLAAASSGLSVSKMHGPLAALPPHGGGWLDFERLWCVEDAWPVLKLMADERREGFDVVKMHGLKNHRSLLRLSKKPSSGLDVARVHGPC